MAGITGISTTFNTDNYHGELIMVSPQDTPLLSAAGGINGGKQTSSTQFEWQFEDLRDPENRPRLEGADAPTAEARVRHNDSNVVQIFHEAVETSYTKMATPGQYTTTDTAPHVSKDGTPNPVTNEHDHQVELALKQIARDVNYVFWHGNKQVPTTNADPRMTGGLLSAIPADNTVYASGAAVAATTATNTVTAASHGLSDGDKVVFVDVGAATNIREDRHYFVVNSAAGTFEVSATAGGSALALGTATVVYVEASGTLTVDSLDGLLGTVYENGGITEGETATLFTGSAQKRAIAAAYADAYGKTDLMAGTRTVGGVNMQRIVTNFGELNLVLDRMLPHDALAVVSMEQVDPVYLAIPGKGVLFEEALAKTGASEKSQIYGEIGLKWGNPHAHGLIRGLAV